MQRILSVLGALGCGMNGSWAGYAGLLFARNGIWPSFPTAPVGWQQMPQAAALETARMVTVGLALPLTLLGLTAFVALWKKHRFAVPAVACWALLEMARTMGDGVVIGNAWVSVSGLEHGFSTLGLLMTSFVTMIELIPSLLGLFAPANTLLCVGLGCLWAGIVRFRSRQQPLSVELERAP